MWGGELGSLRNFNIIREKIKYIMKIKGNKVYYNSDSANFVFECVVPIEQMPKVEPKNSKLLGHVK